MNKINLKKINLLIKKRGDEIQTILPPLPGHPVRQAQAHLYKEIKLRFRLPVAELGDGRFDDVIKLIELCSKHADDPNIKKYLTWVVPENNPGNLEEFFDKYLDYWDVNIERYYAKKKETFFCAHRQLVQK